MFLKDEDGNMYLRPRSRNVKKEFINKIDWVPHLHSFFESLPNGTCLLGEIYLPSNEQAKSTTSIMNCLLDKAIKRQEKEKLIYYIFDVLALNGKSLLEESAKNRFNALESLHYIDYDESYPYIEWAQYETGKELWNTIQNLLADGYEGVVITRGDSHYLPGKRTNKDTLKIKKELQETIDCVVIGANAPTKIYTGKEPEIWEYWFDESTNEKILAKDFLEKTHKNIYTAYVEGATVIPVTKNWFYGWAGSWKLGAFKDGKIVQIGSLSGLTDEMKENWKDYVGKVCEVSAMETSENQEGGRGLRHPKLIAIRDDINPEECTYERIFEK
jgi:ATP-dependent DNA ligase